jgi:hypothetical protein
MLIRPKLIADGYITLLRFIKETTIMTKRIFFLLGVLAGFLFAEVVRRKQLERLKTFEAQKAERDARYSEYEREWKEQIAAMPFERRMEWELFEATLKAHNYQPDWSEEEGEDEESD